MKKLLYSIVFIGSAAFSSAQNLVYTPEQHRIDTVIMENFEAYDINITTPSPEAITFKWKLISNTLPAAWSYSLCDYGACYVGIPSTTETMNAISLTQAQQGTQGFLKINLTCGYNYGNGKVVFYVYDMNDVNRGDTVSFDIRWPAPNAVEEMTDNTLFDVYPNPAKNSVNVVNHSGEMLQATVYNLIGEAVMNFDVAALSSGNVNIADLDKGIYYIAIIDGNKRYLEKLIVQ